MIPLLLALAIQAEAGKYYVELNWIQSPTPGITGNCIYREDEARPSENWHVLSLLSSNT